MVTQRMVAILASAIVMSAGQAYAQQCLHGPEEAAEQAARRKEALGATRQINNIQVNQPGAARGLFFHHYELAATSYVTKNRDSASIKRMSFDPNHEILPGWKLTLDVTADGYWFMVKDLKDPCGFAFVSNKAGLIYTAQHLR